MSSILLARAIKPILLSAFIICSTSVLRADDTMERHAQDELDQAKSTTGLDQTSHLKSALEYLDHLPAGFHRAPLNRARADINAAIFEAQQGDTDHTLDEDIRHAEEDIDHIAP
jgi:hypothetical protein